MKEKDATPGTMLLAALLACHLDVRFSTAMKKLGEQAPEAWERVARVLGCNLSAGRHPRVLSDREITPQEFVMAEALKTMAHVHADSIPGACNGPGLPCVIVKPITTDGEYVEIYLSPCVQVDKVACVLNRPDVRVRNV